jgi:hypothetical protein
MNEQFSGGCACGAVRYELAGKPFDAGWCHCRTCQLVSGAPAMMFASVKVDEHVFTKGAETVATFKSSSFGHRLFCSACGTPLAMRVDYQPETIDVTVSTLDDPDPVEPGFHIFHASKIAWFETRDDLPRHPRFRKDTRGLEGTEPPS